MGRSLRAITSKIVLALILADLTGQAQNAAVPTSNNTTQVEAATAKSSSTPVGNGSSSTAPPQKTQKPPLQKPQQASSRSHLDDLRKNFEKLPQDDQQKFIQSIRKSPPNPASSKPVVVPQANESQRLEGFRRTFNQFPQDEQRQFLVNLRRWQTMSSEERESMRQFQKRRDRKQEEESIEAYQKSGLHLNDAQRQVFRKRYVQERRKLENQLDTELQDKRKQGNEAIIEALKKEFP
jgi:hypothetical protein